MARGCLRGACACVRIDVLCARIDHLSIVSALLLWTFSRRTRPAVLALLLALALALAWFRGLNGPSSQHPLPLVPGEGVSAASGSSAAASTRGAALTEWVPAVGVPVMPGRGSMLLASVLSLDVDVGELFICDNSDGAPDVQCAIESIEARVATFAARGGGGGSGGGGGNVAGGNVAGGSLSVRKLTVLRPRPRPGSPMLGVSECWNVLADAAFFPPLSTLSSSVGVSPPMPDFAAAGAGPHAWLMLMNDDVGFLPGTLAAVAREAWSIHLSHSLLLCTRPLPGEGHAFSAFALFRAGYGALGRFDENFWPAYFEDCDYLQRAVRSPLLWRVSSHWHIEHPTAARDNDHFQTECLRKLPPDPDRNGSAKLAAFREQLAGIRLRVQDGPRDAPHGNSVYFRRKWARECDEIEPPTTRFGRPWVRTPFGDPAASLGSWAFDSARRKGIVKGEL